MSGLTGRSPQIDGVALTDEGAQRPVRLLIDTGAEVSMLAETVLAALQAAPFSSREIAGVFGRELRSEHRLDLRLLLTNGETLVFRGAWLTSMTAVEGDGVDGLIGQDLLAALRFGYDGPAATFTLTV